MSSPSTNFAVLLATPKQIPCAPAITAVLMPTTSPRVDTSGPPELPGLSAASVCTTSSISRPLEARRERRRGGAREPREHPRRDGELESQRIADGDDDLAAAQWLGVAEHRGGEPPRFRHP